MPERLHLQLLPIMSGSKQYLRSLMPSLSQVHGALVTLVTMPVGTRMLYGLAQEGHAPKLFTRLNRFGAPWISVAAVGSFLALGYMTLSSAASVVFDWLQQLVSAASLVHWINIELPWTSPFQPYAAWIFPVSFSIIMLTGGFYVFIEGNWSPQTFVSSYFNIPFIFVLYFGYRFWRKTRLVTLENIPIQEFLHIANEILEPIPSPATGWRRLNILWA
ncbi:unnamed protein product [Penicillium nalgiovense]|uniref:Amino acid permease/ SLC12A domain-containing protein n=1 Tax=Penicillium nalgiovense TaxID=60175 RepID=A0A9W4MNT4_PENNA|nr:unnamed protein product [Penicillium nalgiovense]CAG7981639.1 unnamed protein product [Penicillium nalgiovense]CAG8004931.1 unnamed protein product [Penicillium nalgiovense]CAG8020226.1 unnamed protein product [Penicillium nalgiovense]CAG8067887.1 unnamed protein product [Penicillium nalgiovense]